MDRRNSGRLRQRDTVLVSGSNSDLQALDSLRKFMGISTTIGHKEASEAKLIRYDFGDKFNKLELLHLTDLQIGSKGFQRKRFIEYRDWLLSRPNRFVFLGGDIIDAATILSVASPYENTEEPIDQVETAVRLLRPLSKRGRLLGYVGGNHERRTSKTFGDCGRLIANQLSVPYSRGVQLIDIYFGDWRPFKISLWHGGGSARTRGAQAQSLHRFMNMGDSHCYFMGHLHKAMILPDYRQVRRGNHIKLQKLMGIMSSSFQAWFNSYAEVSAMTPFDTMMGRVILEPNEKWEVTLR